MESVEQGLSSSLLVKSENKKISVQFLFLLVEEDDSDKDGLVSFPEFISAFHSGKMSGLKLRKTKQR